MIFPDELRVSLIDVVIFHLRIFFLLFTLEMTRSILFPSESMFLCRCLCLHFWSSVLIDTSRGEIVKWNVSKLLNTLSCRAENVSHFLQVTVGFVERKINSFILIKPERRNFVWFSRFHCEDWRFNIVKALRCLPFPHTFRTSPGFLAFARIF